MMNLAGDTETKLTDLLGDMFKTNYYRGCYDIQSIMGVGFTVAKVDEKMLKRILEFRGLGKIIPRHCGRIRISWQLLPEGN